MPPDTILQDLRYGARILYRNPWATTITVLLLALGIATNTAVFTGYRAFVARPLDARNPSEMVNLALRTDSGALEYAFSYPEFEAYRDSVHAFQGLVAFRMARLTLSQAGPSTSQRLAFNDSLLGRLGLLDGLGSSAEFAQASVVSENYFTVLGSRLAKGRPFDAGDRTSSSVLVSENYWRRRFQSDPAILGRTIHLNGVPVTVIGITPHDFAGTGVGAPAFWIPSRLEPLLNGDVAWLTNVDNRRYRLFGRLAPGAGIARAEVEATRVAGHLRSLLPATAQSIRPSSALVWPGSPFPLPLSHYRGLNLAIALILAGTAMLLAVAAANTSGLQLARARSREAEMRTRLSLGATRTRLLRQLLIENMLLGLLAGFLALLFSTAFLKLAVRSFVEDMPVEFGALVFDVNPSIPVFLFVLILSLGAAVLSGLVPALESSDTALAAGSRSGTASRRARRLQDLLVALQTAFSLVLLITGSLFVRSAFNTLSIDTGYDDRQVIRLDLQFPSRAAYDTARKNTRIQELRRQLSALPGVMSVSSGAPPGGAARTVAVPAASNGSATPHLVFYTFVEPAYFATLGIPLLAGHTFQANPHQPAVILSQSAANRLWHGENPVGRSVRLGFTDERPHPLAELTAAGPAYEVIAIAGDTRGGQLDGGDSQQVYLPLTEAQIPSRPLLIRTQSDPQPRFEAIERICRDVDREIIATTLTLRDGLRLSAPFVISSLAAAIASTIGALGLLLAITGIFGTVSHIVALRTREVGIRMAIGAQRSNVLGLILSESSRPVVAGLFCGMLLAAGVAYGLRGILYGLRPVDGFLFLAVSLLFFLIAMAASLPPARRAMRVDPVVALRYE